MTHQTLHIGLLLLPSYRWLDAAGFVDYVNNHSQPMMREFKADKNTLQKAPIILWYYISSNYNPVTSSSGPLQIPSCTYADCPPLDYLFVPGQASDPISPLPQGCTEFLQHCFPTLKALLITGTGPLAIAETGILTGFQVCASKIAQKNFIEDGLKLDRKLKVKWQKDKRWIVDGKVWSAAGVAGSIDLAALFVKDKLDSKVVRFVQMASEYKPIPDKPDPFAYILKGKDLGDMHYGCCM